MIPAAITDRRTFTNPRFSTRAELVLEADRAGDPYIEVAVHFDGDGPCVCLTPDTARALAAELWRRADLIERAQITAGAAT